MSLQQEVFCLGHISVDVFVSRLSLQELRMGGCIGSDGLLISGGGDAANVSFWLGKSKIPVSFVGVIANDSAGLFLKNELEKANVKCWLKISSQFPSSTILIVVEPNGERSHIANAKSQDDLLWEDLPLEDILASNLLYTSAYTIENAPIKDTVVRLFQYIKNEQKPQPKTMFNLAAYTTVEKYKLNIKKEIIPFTDILVGNKDEFNALVGNHTKQEVFKIGKNIIEKYPNIEVVLITDGENGCYYFTERHHSQVAALPVSVIDTTGAGDAFCAGFISGYVSGKNMEQAVKIGTILGGKVCRGYGARYRSSEILMKEEGKMF
ncbi:MAG: carbohydrate kinase family protein [Candidatus Heimdallarchaeota archaeon]|nr:MAG: carbohydrate kinase family protein [Candidatus Heimdallarchaeota archaeon]